MAYSDQQIRNYATQLQQKGASSADIESFVKQAKAQQTQTTTDITPPNTAGVTSIPGSKPIDYANPPSWLPGGQIGKFIGERYAKYAPSFLGGAPESAKKYVTTPTTLEQAGGDVLRSAALVGTIATAGVSSLPEIIAYGAGLGAASAAGESMINKASAPGVATSAGKGALAGAITAGVTGGIAKLIGATGDQIVFSNVKPTQYDIKDGLPSDPSKFAELLNKYNIDGSLGNMLRQTQSNLSDFYEELSNKLIDSGSTVDLATVYDKTASDITSQTSQFKTFGINTKLQGALEQLQNEVLQVNPSGEISIPNAQLVKQGAGSMGAWTYGKVDPEASALETVYNSFYHNLKIAIEKASPEGVQEINAKMGELIPLQNALIRRIPVAARQNVFGLRDMIALAASTINPSALALEFGSLASKSAWAGNLLSKLRGASAIAPAIGGMTGSIFSTSPTNLPSTSLQATQP